MYEPQSMVKQLPRRKLRGILAVKGLLLSSVIIAMLSGTAQAANGKIVFEEQGRTRVNLAYYEHYKLPFDLEVHGWFWDDTTIALQCEWFQRRWVGNAPGELYPLYDFFKVNTSDPHGADWVIKDHVEAVILEGGVERSPDGVQAAYFPDQFVLGSLCIYDLQRDRKRTIEGPDSVLMSRISWNPVRNLILVKGEIPDREGWARAGWTDRKPSPLRGEWPSVDQYHSPAFFAGLAYYLYDPTKNEFKPAHVLKQSFLGRAMYNEAVWREDGEAFFFSYCDRGCPSGDTRHYVIGLYNLDSDSAVILYEGEPLADQLVTNLPAYDSSLVFFDYILDRVATRFDYMVFIDFDPLTGRSDTLWTSRGRIDPRDGLIPTPLLSPDRRFVAYYISGHFFVDKLGATGAEQIFSTKVKVGGNQMAAGFDRSGRKLFYVERSSKSRYDIELVWGELKDVK